MRQTINRRQFLSLSGLGAAAAGLAACAPSSSQTPAATDAAAVRPSATLAQSDDDFLLHLLRRTTFGPTAADLDRVASLGAEGWLEEQLAPENLDASEAEGLLKQLSTYGMTPRELIGLEQNGLIARELVAATLIHQVYSPRQLYEQMVDFWSNHFSIAAFAPPELYLKGQDDEQVIRKHALGTFPDLLRASAHSPAMLVYLDNAASRSPSPNENYARELLELHTLGVDGGYTHDDILTLARAFSGWSVASLRDPIGEPGSFLYRAAWHDAGAKTLFGEVLPGGQADGERALDLLAEHPSTARHIAQKLCLRFVRDDPPNSVVQAVADTYLATDGNIADMLRTLFRSPEFAASAGLKLKRPLDFVVSALRVVGAPRRLDRLLRLYLPALGQVPHTWPAPDGFPDAASAWNNTNQWLNRWNFAFDLITGSQTDLSASYDASTSAAEQIDLLGEKLLGRGLSSEVRAILLQFAESLGPSFDPLERGALLAALILSAPHFQAR